LIVAGGAAFFQPFADAIAAFRLGCRGTKANGQAHDHGAHEAHVVTGREQLFVPTVTSSRANAAAFLPEHAQAAIWRKRSARQVMRRTTSADVYQAALRLALKKCDVLQ
jgi:hypothetical protein